MERKIIFMMTSLQINWLEEVEVFRFEMISMRHALKMKIADSKVKACILCSFGESW